MTEAVDLQIAHAFVALARLAGCFMVLPGFASVRVPAQIRAIFVLALTVALMPSISQPAIGLAFQSPALMIKTLVSETMIGVVMGIGARFYILAISFIMIAASSAVGFGSQFAPSMLESDMEPALATFVTTATLLAMFELGFHRDVIIALVGSFNSVPVGSILSPGAVASDLTRFLSDSFVIAFRLGSPFIAYALISNVFVAILNKLVPNLPVYFVATPAVLIGALVLAYNVLPSVISLAAQGQVHLGIAGD